MLLASSVRAQVENFDEALKNTLLAHHQRHVPQVIVKGSEVTLVYAPDMEWTKSAAHDDVAKMDALNCLKADYEFKLHNPTHRLHDYFRVVEYSSWSKQASQIDAFHVDVALWIRHQPQADFAQARQGLLKAARPCNSWLKMGYIMAISWPFFCVNQEIVEIQVLLTHSLFACDILRRLLRRVSLGKSTSAPLRF
jgi:hypothetical protein